MDGNYPRLLLVTANVGSIFEDPDHMLKIWLREFLKTVQHYQPGLLALHCQEVGGKNYEDSMQHVNKFVKAMLSCEELQKYDRARVFLDEDFTAADKFTALGNLYFVHESVEDISIWDFVDCKFIPVVGREVLSGNIETVQIKEKAKFPQDFFPDFKWSRKGFIRTRWNIKNCIFDLVNIHLFHDASNIISMQTSPSQYSKNRKAAFIHTLKRFEEDQYDKVPQFIFGDFNFRLDSQALVNELTKKTTSNQTKGKKGQVNKICYTEEVNNKVVLTVETKGFDCHEKHSEIFLKKSKHLRKYDNEMILYKDRLYEYEINFPPSYPFSEDVSDGLSYMKTRCPSWCDRLLLSHSAKNIIVQNETVVPKYDTIGKDSCMGDHKPVFLFFHLKKSQGNLEDSVVSSQSPLPLAKSLSINGNIIDPIDLEDINIHDFAQFESEHGLSSDFKASIRKRGSGIELTRPNGDRKMSFVEAAKHVQKVRSVLLRWPNRPRSRHHSSSSEDMKDSDSEEIKSNYYNNNIANSEDCLSANTTESDVSESPSNSPIKINTNPGIGNTNTKHVSIETAEHDEHVSLFIFTPTVSAPELLQLPTATEVIVPSTQVKISHVDTTKYIHIRQQNGKSTRVFRETSV
ncbi:E3.1.3.56 [Mytilus coruscus]|uniref:inositol-polyphosphate 5-phosphatase n=1 Tax=Mytilus coruscus TaxID=42192 RepID=A0A6J7ZVK4_MYTCO|nr:E3.1.3.56 [Mytilus coruscus]